MTETAGGRYGEIKTLLLYLFAKNDAADLTAQVKRQLAQLMAS